VRRPWPAPGGRQQAPRSGARVARAQEAREALIDAALAAQCLTTRSATPMNGRRSWSGSRGTRRWWFRRHTCGDSTPFCGYADHRPGRSLKRSARRGPPLDLSPRLTGWGHRRGRGNLQPNLQRDHAGAVLSLSRVPEIGILGGSGSVRRARYRSETTRGRNGVQEAERSNRSAPTIF
jgi:hypothetical protein